MFFGVQVASRIKVEGFGLLLFFLALIIARFAKNAMFKVPSGQKQRTCSYYSSKTLPP